MITLDRLEQKLDALTAGVNSLLEGQQKLLTEQGKNQIKVDLAHGTVLNELGRILRNLGETREALLGAIVHKRHASTKRKPRGRRKK